MLNLDEQINFKKINNIVFGGAGFLGSHLVDKLLKQGENVICIDDFSTGKKININHQRDNKNFFLINHDITKKISSKILIDKIWLLACPASPAAYLRQPIQTIRTNYEGTLNILKLAVNCNSKILFTSSSEIYGLTNHNRQDELMPINLSTSSPRACYSEGKRIAETLISTFSKVYDLEVRIARVFNTYGPRLDLYDGRVISNFINQCLNKKKVTIYGNGSQTRSFCYVSDLINGLCLLMSSDISQPINIGNDKYW